MWETGAHGWSWIGLGLVPMLLIWGLLILGIIAIVRWLSRTSPPVRNREGNTPVDILRERFARGEIDEEEFEERTRILGG